MSDFTPGTSRKPQKEITETAAKASGFKSREVKLVDVAETKAPEAQRRRRTGRNQQINIKTKAEAIEAFYAVADADNWDLVKLLRRQLHFWRMRAKIEKTRLSFYV
ncbi:hypothetical protein ACQQ2Q_22345 [Agrobacterium sp. ES01]|uniref:hypothetical protein n=1 Tax=Agrobacterium sp. ES01 TaxID=3420714 RepID=UPI003D1457BF